MIIIKAILLFIVLLFIFYRAGLIVNKVLKKNNILSIILYGFILITAILQILYIPFIVLHMSFDVVLYTTIIVIGVIIGISFYINKFNKEKKIIQQNIVKIKTMKRKNLIITSVLIIMILMQAITSSLLFNENADDSFYVSLVEQNKTSNAIYSNDPSTGTDKLSCITGYFVSGHELALSVISKVFSIPATTLCHTILPFIMIILSYMAYYVLARKFLNNEKAQIFLLFLSVIFLFSGFTTRLRGIILLSRMWQGKEIFLNIILTLIISNLISINKYNRKKNLFALLLLNFSAVFFTNTAIFLVPFAYLGFAIIKMIKKRWKTLIGLLITGIPIAIYGILYIVLTGQAQSADIANIRVIDVIKDFMGTGYYWILYIVSIIIILWKGEGRAKKYFILVPLIYLVTIYNPLFTEILVKYFTTSSVFWRLFWLLPMEFSIAYSFVLVLNSSNKKINKKVIFITEMVLLVAMGKFAYTKQNGFEIAENLYKIPQAIVNETQYILTVEKEEYKNERKIVVMAPTEPLHSVTMRQIDSRINLFWSRDNYMTGLYSKEEIQEMKKIHDVYLGIVPNITYEEFNVIRKKYEINWIIVNNVFLEVINYIDQTGSINRIEMDGYSIYQYE